jgi:prepilin-type N-terminal cleavage/methylation domain-containing protein
MMRRYHKTSDGFTIVELLIVIVVIAILAAITIVAYNGIQNRARISAVSSALSQANKKLASFAVDGNGYPADLNTIGITDSGEVKYEYSVNNTVNPATYCVTATSGTVSYKASSTAQTPTQGGCAGHGQGGMAAITNLVTNPSIETGTTSYGQGGLTVASATDWANNGTRSLKLTPTGATSDSYTNIGGDTGAIRLGMQAGNTYTVSATVSLLAPQAGALQPNRARTIRVFTKIGANPYVEAGPTAAPNSVGATRLTYTFTVPVGATEAFIRLYNGSNSTTDLVYWDSIMLTSGSSVYNYADGESTNWVWNGSPHSATSTGPSN